MAPFLDIGPKDSKVFIPVVHLNEIGASRQTDKLQELHCWKNAVQELKNALITTGFVYIANHGIQQELIKTGFLESEKFFNLDLDSKMKYERDMGHTFHGYTPPGQKVISPKNFNVLRELRESFDCNIYNDGINDCPYPEKECANFKVTMDTLTSECKLLGIKLLLMLADALSLDELNFFVNHHQSLLNDKVPNYTSLRALYYPKIENVEPGTVRFDEHTDYGTITLLFQDPIGGLEVKHQCGQWMPAPYIPNTILINTGDLLSTWSGGRLPSTLHRVLVPPEEVKLKTKRQSIAFFIKPDNSSVVSSVFENEGEGVKSEFSNVNAGEHFRRRTMATKYNKTVVIS